MTFFDYFYEKKTLEAPLLANNQTDSGSEEFVNTVECCPECDVPCATSHSANVVSESKMRKVFNFFKNLIWKPPSESSEDYRDILSFLHKKIPLEYTVPRNVETYINSMKTFKNEPVTYFPLRTNKNSKYVVLEDKLDFCNTKPPDLSSLVYIHDLIAFFNNKCKYYNLSRFINEYSYFFDICHMRKFPLNELLLCEIINPDGTMQIVKFSSPYTNIMYDRDNESSRMSCEFKKNPNSIVNKFIYNRQHVNPSDYFFNREIVENYKNDEDIIGKKMKYFYQYKFTPYQYMYFASQAYQNFDKSVLKKLHSRSISLSENSFAKFNVNYLDTPIEKFTMYDHKYLLKNNMIVPYNTNNGIVYVFWSQTGIFDSFSASKEELDEQADMIWYHSKLNTNTNIRYLGFNKSSPFNWGNKDEIKHKYELSFIYRCPDSPMIHSRYLHEEIELLQRPMQK